MTAALDNRLILFGGFDVQSGLDLDDTSVWDGTNWSSLSVSGPNARDTSAMATLGEMIVLFGGTNGLQDFGDTWIWDGTSWSSPSVTGPSARSGAAMNTF
jgi:hypothetical protein